MTATTINPVVTETNIFENPTAKDLGLLNSWIESMTESFICSNQILSMDKDNRVGMACFLSVFRNYQVSEVMSISQNVKEETKFGMPLNFWEKFGAYFDTYIELEGYLNILQRSFSSYAVYTEYELEYIEEINNLTDRLRVDFRLYIN